ncbi:MAG: hypothetical protein FD165_2083 [Gammaproteobacteria bacterium]|nr:MAG: hypothetical protein FD165_2083 [Gammaproteobacteria bacterium]TND03468.1 MAG: hypothetical protein FD120_1863 [Gammaproteobacteria bacterium]
MKISPALIVLLVELTVALLVIIGVTVFIAFRRHRQVSVALQIFKQKQMSSGSARQEELLNELKEALRDENDEIILKAEQIIESERVFHNRVIDAFRTRDREAIVKLDDWAKDLVVPYRSLISEVVGSSEKERKEITEKLSEMEEAMEALASERDRMTEELRKKEQEVESMVSEYVSAVRDKDPRSDSGDETMHANSATGSEGSGAVSGGEGAASASDAEGSDDQFLDKDIEEFLEREEAEVVGGNTAPTAKKTNRPGDSHAVAESGQTEASPIKKPGEIESRR